LGENIKKKGNTLQFKKNSVFLPTQKEQLFGTFFVLRKKAVVAQW
jgi:hypothetical protein